MTGWALSVSVSKIDDETYRVVIFYPSQPGSMLNLEVVRDIDGRIVSQNPIEANDATVSLSALPAGYTFETPPMNPYVDSSASRGQYGLETEKVSGTLFKGTGHFLCPIT